MGFGFNHIWKMARQPSSNMGILLLIFLGQHCRDSSGGPPPPTTVRDADTPNWKLAYRKYVKLMTPENTIHSEIMHCSRETILRKKFGNKILDDRSLMIPLYWSKFVAVAQTVPMTIVDILQGQIWPEIILPVIFCLLSLLVAILCLIPMMALGALGWALGSQVEWLGHPKLRKAGRSILIKMEKVRRWYYELAFPAQHLRKFRERDRFQMPPAFQDPNLSEDDEPAELARKPIPRQKTTMWNKKEIEMLGFDPDNILMEIVYGDLLGSEEQLSPEVKNYINDRRNQEMEEDVGRNSFDSDEWAKALRSQYQTQNADETVLNKITSEASSFFNLFNKPSGSQEPSNASDKTIPTDLSQQGGSNQSNTPADAGTSDKASPPVKAQDTTKKKEGEPTPPPKKKEGGGKFKNFTNFFKSNKPEAKPKKETTSNKSIGPVVSKPPKPTISKTPIQPTVKPPEKQTSSINTYGRRKSRAPASPKPQTSSTRSFNRQEPRPPQTISGPKKAVRPAAARPKQTTSSTQSFKPGSKPQRPVSSKSPLPAARPPQQTSSKTTIKPAARPPQQTSSKTTIKPAARPPQQTSSKTTIKPAARPPQQTSSKTTIKPAAKPPPKPTRPAAWLQQWTTPSQTALPGPRPPTQKTPTPEHPGADHDSKSQTEREVKGGESVSVTIPVKRRHRWRVGRSKNNPNKSHHHQRPAAMPQQQPSSSNSIRRLQQKANNRPNRSAANKTAPRPAAAPPQKPINPNRHLGGVVAYVARTPTSKTERPVAGNQVKPTPRPHKELFPPQQSQPPSIPEANREEALLKNPIKATIPERSDWRSRFKRQAAATSKQS